MLDQRQSAIWEALGLGPQWVDRKELAALVEEQKAKSSAPIQPTPAVRPAPQPSPRSAPSAQAQSSTWKRPVIPAVQNPTAEPVKLVSRTEKDLAAIAAMDWEQLRQAVSQCKSCDLWNQRTLTVFGAGSAPSDILLIGEAPGSEEDRKGEPFVGPSGILLDKILQAVGLKRGQNLAIINTIKCRPPRNRDPEVAEMAACRCFFERQIELCDPKLVVVMGKPAAYSVFETRDSLSSLRGRVLQKELAGKNRDIVVTFHPSYLLRKPQDKRKAWEDWCLVANLAENLHIPLQPAE